MRVRLQASSRPATVLLVGLATTLVVVISLARGAPQATHDDFNEFLAAGEFSRAWSLAESAGDNLRDERLADLATAQADAGDLRAALVTTSNISSETFRAEAYAEHGRRPAGAAGGGAAADFDSLIELITTTVSPDTWDDNGGAGSISEFAGGVAVDAAGFLRRTRESRARTDRDLARVLDQLRRDSGEQREASSSKGKSLLRKVSLPRLERALELKAALGGRPDRKSQVLGGLTRIEYLFVYPETGDLVVAGPANDWVIDAQGRPVDVDTGRPMVRLDDLVVMLRHAFTAGDGQFGCSIDPTAEGLSKVQGLLAKSGGKAPKAGRRKAWLESLRAALGPQTVRVFAVDPTTHAARTLVEADQHMKLIGIGLARGTLDVPSYLELVAQAPGEPAASMDVLRWWFTMDYDAIRESPSGLAFQIAGQGVKVQSENERLAEEGRRESTGNASGPNAEFAQRFTKNFTDLAARYPVYAELQNVFDLALVAALVRSEGLDEQVGWRPRFWLDDERCPVAKGIAPAWVDSVVNQRSTGEGRFVASVSGGVIARPQAELSRRRQSGSERVASEHSLAQPRPASKSWSWD